MPEKIPTPGRKPDKRAFDVLEFSRQNPSFKTWQLNGVANIADAEGGLWLKFYNPNPAKQDDSGLTISAGVDMGFLKENKKQLENILNQADLAEQQKKVFRRIADIEKEQQYQLSTDTDVQNLRLTEGQAYKLFGARLQKPLGDVQELQSIRPMNEDLWNTALDIAWKKPAYFQDFYKDHILNGEYRKAEKRARRAAAQTGYGGNKIRYNGWADTFQNYAKGAGDGQLEDAIYDDPY